MSGPTTRLPRVPRVPRAAVALIGVLVAGVLLWQVPLALQGRRPSSPDPSLSPGAVAASASRLDSLTAAVPSTSSTPTSPSLSAAPSTSSGPTPTNPPAIPQAGASWQPDAVLVQAKNEGRVMIDAGVIHVLATAPPPRTYPAAASLDTGWTGLMQEPPRIGTDDRNVSYTDYNYSLFCGAGTAAVVLYYWPATRKTVTTKSGSFVEPVNLGPNRYAKTYWKAQDAGGYGRGMILYLAENEWPLPDRNQYWWPKPGLMNWDARPASTNVQNLVDGINWEASGQTRLNFFYVIVPASQLTQAALLDHVHSDIALGVPTVIAARTSDGKNALPFWRVKPASSAVNHFVTVVGYDDTAGTYTVMDTCGTTCNDRNLRAGVRAMSQAALFSLIQAEPDDDGIMW
jgi:hypothetical protein